ncbi:MAG: hypothetical protein DMF68_15090 [Acidobacteria bacterium]|nr:MAG: hypothetical protein DMF68_15090 [Acidobacteriota bacterium]
MNSLQTELEIILRRLSSLDASLATIDRAAAERALASYLSAHNVARRPVRWAVDAHDAFALVAACYDDAQAGYSEIFRAQDRLGMMLRAKGGPSTDAQMERAPVAVMDRNLLQTWNLVREMVKGHDVILSVPWALYHPRYTPNRGVRITIYGYSVWYNARNVIELLSGWASEFRRWRDDTPLQRGVCEFRLRLMRNLMDAYEAGLWQFWLAGTEIIALPRPTLVMSGGRLHSETGPAVSWSGSDLKYFCLNGVHVSEEIAMTPASLLDTTLMLHERNVDVRREIIRKIGIERICASLNAQCIDRSGDYELLLLDLRDGRVRPFLKMKNPSVPGIYHIEGVAPECRTVAEAIAWRNQSDIPPSVLT